MLVAAAVVIADLCDRPPEEAAAPDPADSEAYTEVADAARATGDLRTAVIAYRKAVSRNAANRRAADELAALCRSEGDAARSHFFLGLAALERHDTGAAIRELELARRDPDYQELAAALLRIAHRDGALSVALLVEPEIDTNPLLVPDTPPAGQAVGAPSPDEDLLTVATVTVRPAPWLALRNALTWRNQRTQSALDFIADDAELTAELVRGRHRISLRAGGDFDLLAGDAYLLAGRLSIAYRCDGETVSPVASYALRRREYLRDDERSFTGWVHAADAGAIVALGAGVELDARAVLRRELTADLTFSQLYTGVRLAMRTRLAAPVRFSASAAAGYARYDGAEPDGALRRDTALEASADLEVDLSDHIIAVAGASAARNQSTLEDFVYDQVIARLGLVIAWGGL